MPTDPYFDPIHRPDYENKRTRAGGPGSGPHARFSQPAGSLKTTGSSRDGKWKVHSQVMQDPETGEKMNIHKFKSNDGREITVSKSLDRRFHTDISDNQSEETHSIDGGTPRTHGSAVNNYTKKNFGFPFPFRPMHPFHQEPKKPYWNLKNENVESKENSGDGSMNLPGRNHSWSTLGESGVKGMKWHVHKMKPNTSPAVND